MKKAFFFLLFLFGLLAGLSSSSSTPVGIELPKTPGPAAGYPLLRIDVFYEPENKVISMDLEDYVKHVVASEMPASFHPEALKAQAVIARTYALRKMQISAAPRLCRARLMLHPTLPKTRPGILNTSSKNAGE